jgi:hypothetical protein
MINTKKIIENSTYLLKKTRSLKKVAPGNSLINGRKYMDQKVVQSFINFKTKLKPMTSKKAMEIQKKMKKSTSSTDFDASGTERKSFYKAGKLHTLIAK